MNQNTHYSCRKISSSSPKNAQLACDKNDKSVSLGHKKTPFQKKGRFKFLLNGMGVISQPLPLQGELHDRLAHNLFALQTSPCLMHDQGFLELTSLDGIQD